VHEAHDHDADPVAWREAGTGPLIVLLHGLGGSRISWEAQLAGLSARFRVAAWDMPGYGCSPPLPVEAVSFPDLAAAAANWIRDLSGPTGRAHVVGISMGGMVAQYLAALHPDTVASLTLLSTSPAFGLDGTRPDEWRSARLAPLDAGQQPADFSERVLRSIAGPSITAAAFVGQQAAMARITADALRRSIDCLVTHDSRRLLGSISAPTLCLVGACDDETPVAYSEALVQHIRGARLEVVNGAGHLLNAEAPEAVNDAITRHVARATSTGSGSGLPKEELRS
jgi:3-oxoadipate enol-lactonase